MSAAWLLFLSLVAVLLALQLSEFDRKHRCWYCNVLLGHTDHCPYNNKDIA